jgi:hypothetical protein
VRVPGASAYIPLMLCRRAPAKLALLLACVLTEATACRSLLPPQLVPRDSSSLSEADLHAEVLELVNTFSAGVTAAAEEISAGSADRKHRRSALLWKVRMIPLVQEVSLSPAREGYVSLYIVCVAQSQYLSVGAGRGLFAEQQQIAQLAATRIEAEVRARSERLFGRERAVALAAQVEQLALEQPIQGEFVAAGLHRSFAKVAPGGKLDWVFAMPMAPFKSLQGVESGAQAIHELNETARQLGDIAASLPMQSRWQTELLLYDVEDRESVARILAAFEQLSASAARFNAVAEQLPSAMRQELSALLEESSAAQVELRRTLDAIRQATGGIDATLANARPLAESLERIAGSANEAGASWGELVARLRAPAGTPSSARPFDVTEYERTAAGIRDAASELRALIETARAGEASLANALLWRGLALLGAFFALLLLYRLVAARLGLTRPAADR